MDENKSVEKRSWINDVFAITLFINDLEETKKFYEEVFQLEPIFEDVTSVVFRFNNIIINLLISSAVDEFIAPLVEAPSNAAIRSAITISVEDVDQVCEHLKKIGVPILLGPIDRPWGPRTANFVDPSGHLFEISS